MNETGQGPHSHAHGGILQHPELFKPECCCIFKNVARMIPFIEGDPALGSLPEMIEYHGPAELADKFYESIRPLPPGFDSMNLKDGKVIVHLSGNFVDEIAAAILKIAEKYHGQKKTENNS